VKEPNIMFHNYETEKIARKASDAAEILQSSSSSSSTFIITLLPFTTLLVTC